MPFVLDLHTGVPSYVSFHVSNTKRGAAAIEAATDDNDVAAGAGGGGTGTGGGGGAKSPGGGADSGSSTGVGNGSHGISVVATGGSGSGGSRTTPTGTPSSTSPTVRLGGHENGSTSQGGTGGTSRLGSKSTTDVGKGGGISSSHNPGSSGGGPGSAPGDSGPASNEPGGRGEESLCRELTLSPGRSRQLQVRYKASLAHIRAKDTMPGRLARVALHVSLNAVDTNGQHIERRTLTGLARVCESLVKLSANELDFGEIQVKASKTQSVTVRNISDLATTVEVHFSSRILKASPQRLELAPQDSATVELELSPTDLVPTFEKSVTLINLRNRANDQTLVVRASIRRSEHAYKGQVYSVILDNPASMIGGASGAAGGSFRHTRQRSIGGAADILGSDTGRTSTGSSGEPSRVKSGLGKALSTGSAHGTHGMIGRLDAGDVVSGSSILQSFVVRNHSQHPISLTMTCPREEVRLYVASTEEVTTVAGSVVTQPQPSELHDTRQRLIESVQQQFSVAESGRPETRPPVDRRSPGELQWLDLASTTPATSPNKPATAVPRVDGLRVLSKITSSIVASPRRAVKAKELLGLEDTSPNSSGDSSSNEDPHESDYSSAPPGANPISPVAAQFTPTPANRMRKYKVGRGAPRFRQQRSGGGGGGGGGETTGGLGAAARAAIPGTGAGTGDQPDAAPPPAKATADKLCTVPELAKRFSTALGSAARVFASSDAEGKYVTSWAELQRDLKRVLRMGRLSHVRAIELRARQKATVYVIVSPAHQGNAVGRWSKLATKILFELAGGSRAPSPQPTRALQRTAQVGPRPAGPAELVPKTIREMSVLSRVCSSVMFISQARIQLGKLQKNEVRSRTIVLANVSAVPLLYRVRKTGSIASNDLHIMQGGQGVVTPFQKKEIHFMFKPSMAGAYSEDLLIENVLDSSNSQTVYLRAFVEAPQTFSLKPGAMDFGGVSAGDASQSCVLELSNISFRTRRYVIYLDAKSTPFKHCVIHTQFEPLGPQAVILSKATAEKIEKQQRRLQIALTKGQQKKQDKINKLLDKLRAGIDDDNPYASDSAASDDEMASATRPEARWDKAIVPVQGRRQQKMKVSFFATAKDGAGAQFEMGTFRICVHEKGNSDVIKTIAATACVSFEEEEDGPKVSTLLTRAGGIGSDSSIPAISSGGNGSKLSGGSSGGDSRHGRSARAAAAPSEPVPLAVAALPAAATATAAPSGDAAGDAAAAAAADKNHTRSQILQAVDRDLGRKPSDPRSKLLISGAAKPEAATVALHPAKVDFGEVTVATELTGSFEIENLMPENLVFVVIDQKQVHPPRKDVSNARASNVLHFDVLNGRLGPNERRKVGFSLTPRAAGRHQYQVQVQDIKNKFAVKFNIHVSPRAPQYLQFPDFADPAAIHIDAGLCYLQKTTGFVKVVPVQLYNGSPIRLTLSASSNLRQQVSIFRSDALETLFDDVEIGPQETITMHVALRSLHLPSGESRKIECGIRVNVWQHPKPKPGVDEALAQHMVRFTATVGRSMLRMSNKLLKLGVASTLGAPLSRSFIIRNPSHGVPVQFSLRPPAGVELSTHEGTIAPRSSETVKVSCRTVRYGLTQYAIEVTNVSAGASAPVEEVLVLVYADEGILQTNLADRPLDFGRVCIAPITPLSMAEHDRTLLFGWRIMGFDGGLGHQSFTLKNVSDAPYLVEPYSDLACGATFMPFGPANPPDTADPFETEAAGTCGFGGYGGFSADVMVKRLLEQHVGDASWRPELCGRANRMGPGASNTVQVSCPPPKQLSKHKWDKLRSGGLVDYYGTLHLQQEGTAVEGSAAGKVLQVVNVKVQYCVSLGEARPSVLEIAEMGYSNSWASRAAQFRVANVSQIPLVFGVKTAPPLVKAIAVTIGGVRRNVCLTLTEEAEDTLNDARMGKSRHSSASDTDTLFSTFSLEPGAEALFDTTVQLDPSTAESGNRLHRLVLANLRNPHNDIAVDLQTQCTTIGLSFDELSSGGTLQMPNMRYPLDRGTQQDLVVQRVEGQFARYTIIFVPSPAYAGVLQGRILGDEGEGEVAEFETPDDGEELELKVAIAWRDGAGRLAGSDFAGLFRNADWSASSGGDDDDETDGGVLFGSISVRAIDSPGHSLRALPSYEIPVRGMVAEVAMFEVSETTVKMYCEYAIDSDTESGDDSATADSLSYFDDSDRGTREDVRPTPSLTSIEIVNRSATHPFIFQISQGSHLEEAINHKR